MDIHANFRPYLVVLLQPHLKKQNIQTRNRLQPNVGIIREYARYKFPVFSKQVIVVDSRIR